MKKMVTFLVLGLTGLTANESSADVVYEGSSYESNSNPSYTRSYSPYVYAPSEKQAQRDEAEAHRLRQELAQQQLREVDLARQLEETKQ